MKQRFLVIIFLLSSGITLAGFDNELDSLRRIVLLPKIQKYQSNVEEFTKLINATSDKSQIRRYAKQIIEASEEVRENIKQLYGYAIKSSIRPLYIGQNVQTLMYPNIGGFIFPLISVKVGSLPDITEEIDWIKDYAWRIRLAVNSEMVKRNVKNIDKRNSRLLSV